jgi:anaerobic ribonucleoside-triphosphate reductase activating protein
MLRIHATHPHTRGEGPGERFAIWVQGCSIRCPGCCNPEMLDTHGGASVPVDDLAREAIESGCEGVSLLGGEPFDQAHACGELARMIQDAGLGVMTFTGYEYQHLLNRSDAALLLENTDLLKAGPYRQELHARDLPWAGSANQRLNHLSPRYRNHPDVSKSGRQSVTIALDGDEMTVSGWPQSCPKPPEQTP